MKSLAQILNTHNVPASALGGNINRDALHLELSKLQRHLRNMSVAAAAMTGAVFVIEIVLVIIYVNSPAVVVSVAAAMGLTVAGAIGVMRRLATETAQVTLLVILSGTMTADKIASVVGALVKKLPDLK
jgi:hypothetical protein